MEITSSAFTETDFIPARYTCDGENISPPLSWEELPEEAKSLVLLCEDIDSVKGIWSHWVVYRIPPAVDGFEEDVDLSGAAPSPEAESEILEGVNDFDETGYGGPCPSDGKTHRYRFRLLALQEQLDLPPGAIRERVLEAARDLIIEEAVILGQYRLQEDD